MTSISLVFVADDRGSFPIKNLHLDFFLEVFEVSSNSASALRAVSVKQDILYKKFVKTKGLARALNLAVSFASSEWILFIYGDTGIDAGNLPDFRDRISDEKYCVKIFRSPSGGLAPVTAIRRKAFIYGAFDERFKCQRLTVLHWVYKIFPRPKGRYAPCEGVDELYCEWVSVDRAAVEHPVAALVELWSYLTVQERAILLQQALAESKTIREDFRHLLDLELKKLSRKELDPYRCGKYDPKRFWEENTEDYVKWEVYQPDEPEILDMINRISAERVLELGCGAGRNARYFSDALFYIGMDLSMNLLGRALDRQSENSVGLVCADATALCFKDASFDFVFADSTIQHIEPDKINQCVYDIVRVSAKYICLIEFTDEVEENGTWFQQIHMFRHDYEQLFGRYCKVLFKKIVDFSVQPAVKKLFLFEKIGGMR